MKEKKGKGENKISQTRKDRRKTDEEQMKSNENGKRNKGSEQ